MKTFTLIVALLLATTLQAQVKKDNTIILDIEEGTTIQDFGKYLLTKNIFPASYNSELDCMVSEWSNIGTINVEVQFRAAVIGDKIKVTAYFRIPSILGNDRVELKGMKKSPTYLSFQHMKEISEGFPHLSIEYRKE